MPRPPLPPSSPLTAVVVVIGRCYCRFRSPSLSLSSSLSLPFSHLVRYRRCHHRHHCLSLSTFNGCRHYRCSLGHCLTRPLVQSPSLAYLYQIALSLTRLCHITTPCLEIWSSSLSLASARSLLLAWKIYSNPPWENEFQQKWEMRVTWVKVRKCFSWKN